MRVCPAAFSNVRSFIEYGGRKPPRPIRVYCSALPVVYPLDKERTFTPRADDTIPEDAGCVKVSLIAPCTKQNTLGIPSFPAGEHPTMSATFARMSFLHCRRIRKSCAT